MKRVILCHDWLNGMRGGEKCLLALLKLYPGSEIRTLIADRSKLSEEILRVPIRTSFVQRIPAALKRYKWFLPLFPFAVRGLDPAPGECDAVISTSHCVAKGIRAPLGVPHVCYCFTPMRYAWLFFDEYFGSYPAPVKWLIRPVLAWLRWWDKRASRTVTNFIAISEHVRKRIQRFYGRDASVIYPPADVDFFRPTDSPREDFYLLVSALVPYKRPDLAVEACKALGKKLIVIGSGPELERLRSLAGSGVEFKGWTSNEMIRNHYQRCRALIFPGEEDYGIVPVEAQACGAPVLAYGVGGVRETVRDGVTGVLFDEQTVASLSDAIRRCERTVWDPSAIRAQSELFSEKAFLEAFGSFMAKKYDIAVSAEGAKGIV